MTMYAVRIIGSKYLGEVPYPPRGMPIDFTPALQNMEPFTREVEAESEEEAATIVGRTLMQEDLAWRIDELHVTRKDAAEKMAFTFDGSEAHPLPDSDLPGDNH